MRSLERSRISKALIAAGFVEQPGAYFNTAYILKLKSADHSLYFTLSSYDTITQLQERILDCAWRSRIFTKITKREVIGIANKIIRLYEQEAFRDPTGGGNAS